MKGISAVRQVSRHALLWLILTITAAAIAVATGYVSFGFLPDRRLLIALSECCIFIIAGMLLGWHETVDDRDSQKVMAPVLARVAGCTLIGLSLVGYVVAFTYYGRSPLMWFANVLVLAAVAAASYQLLPLVGLLAIWGHRMLMILVSSREFALRLLVGTIFVVAAVIAELILIMAKPIELIVTRRKPALSSSPLPLESRALVVQKELTPSGESK